MQQVPLQLSVMEKNICSIPQTSVGPGWRWWAVPSLLWDREGSNPALFYCKDKINLKKTAAETWGRSAQPSGLATCHLCQQCPRCGACNLERVEEAACRSSLQSLRKGQGWLLSLGSLGMLFASAGRDMWLALLAFIRTGNPWEALSYKCHAETESQKIRLFQPRSHGR